MITTHKRRNLRMSLPSFKNGKERRTAPRLEIRKNATGSAFRELRHSLRPRLTALDLIAPTLVEPSLPEIPSPLPKEPEA